MLNRLLQAALICSVPAATLTQSTAQPVSPEPNSMRFEWMREGPAESCGEACREWIAATGAITADTLRDFELFTEARDVRGALLVLDSGGGSVLASLDFGRKVREFGLKTSVGRTTKLPSEPGLPQRARLSPRGECASMCVFVLLGGVERRVPPEARILVHQIWPGSKRHDASAESYTAEEMVRIQRDVGRIARYTVEMGGDIELFELAMRIPPWERLRSLSPPELRRMRLQTVEVAPEAPTSGAVSSERPVRLAGASRAERGWAVARAANHPAVFRRHPLTVEGDEIGHFQLSLTCGEGASAYKLEYLESRMPAPEAPVRGAQRTVSEAWVWVGGERISLHIESSALADDAPEVITRASGTISAEAVRKLQGEPNGVVIVGTQGSDGVRSGIRLGATGFAGSFSQLSAECAGGGPSQRFAGHL